MDFSFSTINPIRIPKRTRIIPPIMLVKEIEHISLSHVIGNMSNIGNANIPISIPYTKKFITAKKIPVIRPRITGFILFLNNIGITTKDMRAIVVKINHNVLKPSFQILEE